MPLPPGPQSPNWLQLAIWLRKPFWYLERLRRDYGDTFTLRFPFFGARSLVVYSNPEHVKEVFADDGEAMHAGKANIVLEPFVGANSLLILDGAPHKRQRKLIMPPLHGERMHAYGRQMLDITDGDIDGWPVGKPFSLQPHTQSITMDVILRTVFGIAEGERFQRLRRLMNEGLRLVSWSPMMFPIMQKDLGRWSPWGKYLHVANQVDAILIEEIHNARATDVSGRTDILSLLVQARDDQGEAMTDAELRDELVTLLLAGHETTATGLAWAMRWIHETPGLRERLLTELRPAIDGDRLVPERVAKLELLDATVREALRLQPVVPMVGRVMQKNTRVGGWEIPKGHAALVSIYLVHRRPDLYPEPDRFRPDRFLGWKPAAHEWIPFGGGVRRCVGAAFAMYEMKIVLAAMLTRATMRLAPTQPITEIRRHITLAPSEGLRVVVDELHSRGAYARAA